MATHKVTKRQLIKELNWCKACDYEYFVVYKVTPALQSVHHCKDRQHLDEVIKRYLDKGAMVSFEVVNVKEAFSQL